jgi:benzoate-CoA ligase family protein
MSRYNAAAWLLDRNIAEGRGEQAAVICQGRVSTYYDVLADVYRVQAALARFGVAAGERVLMVLNDDPVFVAWFLGCLRSGVIPVPVSTMLMGKDLAALALDSSAKVLAISGEYADRVGTIVAGAPSLAAVVLHGDDDSVALARSLAARGDDTGAQDADGVTAAAVAAAGSNDQVTTRIEVGSGGIAVYAWSSLASTSGSGSSLGSASGNVSALGPGSALGSEAGRESASASEWPVADTTWDSPGFWLYSSGTTGLPKGVIHKQGDLQASFDTYAAQVLKVTAEDRFLSVAKLFFAYGLGNSLTFPFGAGATSILEPRRPTPAIYRELAASEKPTLFFAAPGFVAALLDAGVAADEFSSVRATVTAGEALPADLQKRFSARCGHPVLDGIGTTEATHIFLSNTLDHQQPGTSGFLVPGYTAKLVNDEGLEVTAPNTPGYLHVQGPSVMDGYWNRAEATAAALVDGWLRTGDVYVFDEGGHWQFLGRNNDMIKAGGIWVSPAEVEAALISHEDVLEAAVVGSRNAAGLEETVAFVVAASGRTIDLAVIESHCRAQIAAFKRPRRIIIVDTLPKTATGKIQRFALRDQLAADG